MLCANLFAAQLVFVVGVERTENEVFCTFPSLYCDNQSTVFMSIPDVGCLFSHCYFAPLPVSGGVHVDADGGCGLVCSSGEGVCQTHSALHHCFHDSQLR